MTSHIVATVKFKNMSIEQINDFLGFTFSYPSIKVSNPDVRFEIVQGQDLPYGVAETLGMDLLHHFYLAAYDVDGELIEDQMLRFELNANRLCFANGLHKLLSPNNPYVEIDKKVDLSFDDMLSMLYLEERAHESVLNESHVEAAFKEFAALAVLPTGKLKQEIRQNYVESRTASVKAPNNCYINKPHDCKIFEATAHFLKQNGLLLPKSLDPGVISANKVKLSSEEAEFRQYFLASVEGENPNCSRPQFNILEKLGVVSPRNSNVFKKIFDKNKKGDLEMEF